MTTTSALRAHCHARVLLRSGVPTPLDEGLLRQARLLAQGLLAAWSLARILVDAVRARPSGEGGLALLVLVTVVASLVLEAALRPGGRGGRRKKAARTSLATAGYVLARGVRHAIGPASTALAARGKCVVDAVRERTRHGSAQCVRLAGRVPS